MRLLSLSSFLCVAQLVLLLSTFRLACSCSTGSSPSSGSLLLHHGAAAPIVVNEQNREVRQQGRHMLPEAAAQPFSSASTQQQQWRPIRIKVNTTFVTSSQLDIFSIGGVQTCQSAGQVITVGQVSTATAPSCTSSRTVENCKYTCTTADIVTPSATQRIAAAVQEAASWAESFLLVNASDEQQVSIYDPAASSTYTAGNVNCGFMSLGTGNSTVVSGVDFVLYVTVRPLSFLAPFATQFAPDAVSDVCVVRSDSGRPLQSRINIQPSAASSTTSSSSSSSSRSSASAMKGNLTLLARHMMLHALGLSTTAVPYYRNPITLKRYIDEGGAAAGVVIANTSDTSSSNKSSSSSGIIGDPSYVFKGYNSSVSPPPISGGGGGGEDTVSQLLKIDPSRMSSVSRVALRTPTVLQAAREFFNCPDMPYVELENVGGMDEHGDVHWESRLMLGDIMSPMPISSNDMDDSSSGGDGDQLSYLTLAWLVDTGYYAIDDGMWGRVRNRSLSSVQWGRGRGCGWVKDNCTGSATRWGGDYQCTSPFVSGNISNSVDADVVASVGFNNRFYSTCPETAYAMPLPDGYQHFPDPNVGGTDFFADFCSFTAPWSPPSSASSSSSSSPVVSCNVSGRGLSVATRSVGTYEDFSEMNGPSTRAVLSTLVNASFFSPPRIPFAECLQFLCLSATSLLVRAGSTFVSCPSFQNISLDYPFRTSDPFTANYTSFDYVGSLRCPNVSALCGASFRAANSDLWIGRRPSSSSMQPLTWPQITSISQPNISYNGGDTITISGSWPATGTITPNCSGVRIGGVVMMGVSIGTSLLIVNTTDFSTYDSKYGGNNSDGSGTAAVELLCTMTTTGTPNALMCDLPGGACSVTAWPDGILVYMNLGSSSSGGGATGSGSGAADRFFRTTTGQVVLALIGLSILVLAAAALKALSPAPVPGGYSSSPGDEPTTAAGGGRGASNNNVNSIEDPFGVELLSVAAAPDGAKQQQRAAGVSSSSDDDL